MNRALPISGVFILGLTIGCSPEVPTHTPAWYRDHPDMAQREVDLCEQQPIQGRGAECLNAQEGMGLAAFHGEPEVNPWR